jgi:hypothetical protein
MTFGGLLSLTPIFKAVLEENNRITTMATAIKNGPLLLHMSSNFGSILVGLTGNDAPSKRIFFSCNEGVYRP